MAYTRTVRAKIVSIVAVSLSLAFLPVLYVSSVAHRKNLLSASEETLATTAAALGSAVGNLVLDGQARAAARALDGFRNVRALRVAEVYRPDGSPAFREGEALDRAGASGGAHFKRVLESLEPLSAVLPGTREIEYYAPILDLAGGGKGRGTAPAVRGVVYLRLSTERVHERVVESAVTLAVAYAAAAAFIVLVLLFFLKGKVIDPLPATRGGAGLPPGGEFPEEAPPRGGYEPGERRKLAVLFSDIKRVGPFAGRNSPHEVIEALGGILRSQAELVGRYGGEVDAFAGNAVTALFDDGYGAVRCAYQMVRSAVENERERGHGLLVGIGVSEGEVVLGSFPTPDGRERAVVGDAVNLASRLGRLARRSMVVVSGDLAASLGGRVRAKPVPGKTGFFVLEGVLDEETGRWLK